MGCQEESGEENWCNDNVTGYRSGYSSAVYNRNQVRSCNSTNSQAERNAQDDTGFNPSSAEEEVTDHPRLWLYRGNEVDLSNFLRFHPGGTPALRESRGREVGPSMKTSPHSSEAYYLLRDFYDGNAEEDIVDWSKPMLSQVGSLGPQYASWVWSPVNRPLRLFQYDWVEKITRTNWKQVMGVWIPVISIASALSFIYIPPHVSIWVGCLGAALSILSGMAVWPLLEYSIHRWVFHLQPPKNSSFLITIHFGLHGLHHKVPFDEGRLLFPPGPCSVMAVALYQVYTRLLPWWIAMAFFSGTMLGYLIYDLIHYYLHHGNPKEGSYLYYMKRYHNQHHFAQQEKGFGISSDFWDNAFDTIIKLKKLTTPLTWE